MAQSEWIGKTDIFDRHPDDTAGQKKRVLAGFEHSGKPIKRRLGVTAPNALMEGRNEIIVFLSSFVVMNGFAQQSLFRGVEVHIADSVRIGRRGKNGNLEGIQNNARIPAGSGNQIIPRIGSQPAHVLSKSVSDVGQSALYNLSEVRFIEGFEYGNLCAGKKRPDDFEGRVLRRGAKQQDSPVFDMGEQRVLLCFVEPVDLIHEEPGSSLLPGKGLFCFIHGSPDFTRPGHYRRKINEMSLRLGGDYFGQGCFPASGWPPEDERMQVACLDKAIDNFSRPEQMALADKLTEVAGTQALRQGSKPARNLLRGFGEYIQLIHR